MHSWFRILASLTLFCTPLALGTPLHAADLQVPGDHPTIRAAIDVAVAGDVVVIAAGTYLENIRLFGKAITLRGAGIDLTTIDAATRERIAQTPSSALGTSRDKPDEATAENPYDNV